MSKKDEKTETNDVEDLDSWEDVDVETKEEVKEDVKSEEKVEAPKEEKKPKKATKKKAKKPKKEEKVEEKKEELPEGLEEPKKEKKTRKKGELSEKMENLYKYLKEQGDAVPRKKVAVDLGTSFGPMCYQLAKKGLAERVQKEDGIYFKAVEKK